MKLYFVLNFLSMFIFQVWFQNRRAKWKKRKKTTNVFRTPGALLPSHGLPPFGANITNIAMGEGLCGSSMFGGDRWSVGVNPMTAGKLPQVECFGMSLLNLIWCGDFFFFYFFLLIKLSLRIFIARSKLTINQTNLSY